MEKKRGVDWENTDWIFCGKRTDVDMTKETQLVSERKIAIFNKSQKNG